MLIVCIIAIVIGWITVFFFMSRKQQTSSQLANKIDADFNNLPESKRQKVLSMIGQMEYALNNQIQYLPSEVLETTYAQETIKNFILAYFFELVNKQGGFHDMDSKMVAFFKVLTKIYNNDMSKIEKFNIRSVINHTDFHNMTIIVKNMMPFPIVNHIAILVFMERDYEKQTGKRIRFMEIAKSKDNFRILLLPVIKGLMMDLLQTVISYCGF
jgi:hypothetical protein